MFKWRDYPEMYNSSQLGILFFNPPFIGGERRPYTLSSVSPTKKTSFTYKP